MPRKAIATHSDGENSYGRFPTDKLRGVEAEPIRVTMGQLPQK